MSNFPRKATLEYRQRFGIWPQEAAGLRALRKPAGVKGFGRLVGVYDGRINGMDTEGGRWQTVCEIHSAICSHVTLADAMAHATHSEGWCEACEDREGFIASGGIVQDEVAS